MKSSHFYVRQSLNVVLSILLWVVAVIHTILCVSMGILCVLPYCLLTGQTNRYPMHQVARIWARGIIALAPFWNLEVKGLNSVKSHEHYVVVANHQSILDIIVTLAGLPLHFKFIAKQELFSIPFLGWHMFFTGYIPLDRGNAESARRVLGKASEWLNRGVSILMFPEGTRSRTGQIHAFKPGAFKLAKNDRVKILPVVIDNTGDAIPKSSWILRKSTCFKMTILQPVLVSGEDLAEQVESVRSSMIEVLQKMRSR